MEKTRMQLDSELYAVLRGQVLAPLHKIIAQKFPKARGTIVNLTNKEMVEVIAIARELYGKPEK